jgi:hypothetical protein
MEESLMATSLMLALLDIPNAQALAAAPQYSPAGLYNGLSPNQKAQVREAVYEAFYAILESQLIDYMPGAAGAPASRGIAAANGIGLVLARVLSADMSPMSANEIQNVATLKSVLRDAMDRAVNRILVP